jgi:hypothetical protein
MPLEAKEELEAELSGASRVIIIAEKDVDLSPSSPDNRLVLLRIAEGSLAGGGRGGGFGERKVVHVSIYSLQEGKWSKLRDISERASEFEVPYYVTRLPFTKSDKSEAVGYGVVDSDLAREMIAKAEAPSSA